MSHSSWIYVAILYLYDLLYRSINWHAMPYMPYGQSAKVTIHHQMKVSGHGGTPKKNHFRLGFSIITFWVPPCMETPKWSKVLKYVEDVFAGISPLKFNGKITFLVSTSNFQGSALSFIPFSLTETSVMQSMRRKILPDYVVNVIPFFPPCTLHIGLSKLGTPKS